MSRYTSEREDRNKGHDIIYYLSRSLGCDSSCLRLSLNRHPHWQHVSLPSVRTTLLALAEKGFSREQIRCSVHVLLYPTAEVIETLASMNYTTPANAQDWSKDLKFDHIEFDEDTVISENSDPLFKEIVSQKYSEASSLNDLLQELQVEDSPVTEWNLVLSMCIYLLEKPHHFTGDGIWNQLSMKEDKEVVSVAVM